VFLQQKVLSGRSYTTVAGKAFRPRSLNLGDGAGSPLGSASLPPCCGAAADACADRRGISKIHVHRGMPRACSISGNIR